jgi:hypothetical protein
MCVAGSFYQLCKEFGETPTQQNMEVFHRKQRRYVLPKTKVKPTSSPVEEYLTLRGFSKETWERFGIGDSDGNIAIPFTENGKVVMVKFRHPRKTKKGEQKEWKEKGGKPIFWGMDHCAPDKPLLSRKVSWMPFPFTRQESKMWPVYLTEQMI